MDKKKLIIIEDDMDISEELSEILQLEGFTVHTAASAREAMKFFSKNSYFVCLLDLKLPGNGFEIIKKLQENKKIPRLIIITGSPLEMLDKSKKYLLDCAENIFMKPFNIEELIRQIRRTDVDKKT